VDVLILVVAILRRRRSVKNSVKYIQGINFLQLTLVEKNYIKNSCRATPDLVISQSSPRRIYVRNFNPTLYAKHKWMSGCAKGNALLGLLINHIITPAPTPP
jgi:hypothetical protein